MKFDSFLLQEGKKIEKAEYEHVFRQGDSDKSLYFVQSGLLKVYYSFESCKKSVKSFIVPQDIIGSLTSTCSEEGCSFSLLCLEPAVLIRIPFTKLLQYSQQDHEIANSLIDSLLKLSMKKERREYEFLCLSAEERYCLLADTSPKLLEKVTQNDIARYLGVTPVGLSRIKNRVNNR